MDAQNILQAPRRSIGNALRRVTHTLPGTTRSAGQNNEVGSNARCLKRLCVEELCVTMLWRRDGGGDGGGAARNTTQ